MAQKTIRLVVTGCCGRMGSSLIAEATVEPFANHYHLVAGIEYPGHPQIGQALPNYPNLRVRDDLADVLRDADLLIEFTTPEATVSNALTAAQARVPMVVGTTGLSEEQFKQLRYLAKEIPIFWSPNMSLGVFIVREAIRLMSKHLKNFGLGPQKGNLIQIAETHHINKKDMPSGTAKQIAEDIADVFQIPKERIPIESKREGDVIGLHTVTIDMGWEQVEVRHNAIKRTLFAFGALLCGRCFFENFKDKPGWYTMDDVMRVIVAEK